MDMSSDYDDDCVKHSLEAEVHGRQHHLARPHHLVSHTSADVEDRDDWRRRTRVADPSLEGFTACKRE